MDGKKLPMGIVLRDLEAFQKLIHIFTDESTVASYEFTYRAPLYKFSREVSEKLAEGLSSLEKFDLYYEKGILDEKARVQLAAKFRADYIRKNPASEASDLFFASGDVLAFKLLLRPPSDLVEMAPALDAIAAHPHDEAVFKALCAGGRIDENHFVAEVHMFLDHVYNPRRRDLPIVKQAMTGARARDPVIVEMYTSGAIPGYFIHILEPPIHDVDGALVMLPG
jgi:hypothetical protein